MTKALALLLLCSAASAYAGQNTSGYSVESRFPIRGTMTWDYITVDAFAHRLYVAHGTQVEVLTLTRVQASESYPARPASMASPWRSRSIAALPATAEMIL